MTTEPVAPRRGPEPVADVPGVYAFAPRRSVRRFLTVVMLVGLAMSAYLVRDAVELRDSASIGLAAIATLGTALVWAIRGGASITTLTVRTGQLEVVRQGGRLVFDLTSDYTPVEVVGKPGRRGWKVLFLRPDMSPFVIDAAMVDPHDFMRVLRFFRPGLPR